MRLQFIISAALVLSAGAVPVFGCKCVASAPGTITARERAELAANGEDAIFEGKVESAQLKWRLIEARIGEAVSANVEDEWPEMDVLFEVLRSYRGVEQKHVRVATGLGGGDCGFRFELGKKYLVYSSKNERDQLWTGICSATALLEESQTNLEYLRGEVVDSEIAGKKASIGTGKLCGLLVLDNSIHSIDGRIVLFRSGDISPLPAEEGDVETDGSFCVPDLVPGKYFLQFMDGPEESPSLFAFYPGVTALAEATAIELAPGQTVSHLLFKVPVQHTYSVSGRISNFSKSELQAEPKIMLVSEDQPILALAYGQEIASNGTFALARVLPGRYWAVVTVESPGATKWSTRKVEVDVAGNVTGVSLELIAN